MSPPANHSSIISGPREEWHTLVEMLRSRADENSDTVAFTFLADGEHSESHITYGDLDARARAIASALQERQTDGSPVLLLFPPGLDYIAGFFGCLYAGALAVPAYPPFNERQFARLQRIAINAGAKLVLSLDAAIGRARMLLAKAADLPAAGANEAKDLGFEWLAVDKVDQDGGARWTAPHIAPSDLAFLQYTSGSTASPKGVMLTHQNLMHNLRCINRMFALRPGSTSTSWLPPYHDMGLIGQILEPIYGGVHTYLMSPASFLQSPLRWLQTISRTRSEVSGGPNFAYDLCTSKAQGQALDDLDLSSWRVAFNGAEPIRAQTLARFAQVFKACGFDNKAFYPCYGMAEGTLILSGGDHEKPAITNSYASSALQGRQAVPSSDAARSLVSSGQPSPDHVIKIVDPATSTPLPDGRVGEIWVSGPSVATGYWKREQLSREVFVRLGETDPSTFLRTGDLGFFDHGELYVVGRLKDLIILRGRNLHAEDLEFTLNDCHPDLRPGSAAAFSAELDGEERLVIVQEVVRKPTDPLESIASAVRRAIAEDHGVEVFSVALLQAASIAKTSSGKIQRYACREAYLAGELRERFRWTMDLQAKPPESIQPTAVGESGNGKVAPKQIQDSPPPDEIADWLVHWVSTQTRVAQHSIALSEPLTAYGLASRDLVQLSGDLEEWLGARLSPVLAYQYPTIESLAQHLGSQTTTRSSSRRVMESEPIAIVGLSCRFPGAESPEAFWNLLVNRVDAVSDTSGRFPPGVASDELPCHQGGLLPGVDGFDAEFFRISPREATHMDPQQRLLLEVSWQALERAGMLGAQRRVERTGVFVGISSNDYAQLMVRDAAVLDHYVGTGTALSVAANRLSYQLDLSGPSLAIDTACSSSLVAVHLAVNSLRRGECDAALAAGVNLLLSPDPTIVFSKARMLAKDGRCKTFDSAADGYVRGEGCGVLVLKRLSDALRDGNHVVAVIRGTGLTQDGRSNGLTAPNGLSQQGAIRDALLDADLSPADIDYIEAHGTGTPLGDPIEVEALKSVLLAGRPTDRLCGVGSVKTNIGHLEAAAGIAGLVKAALAVEHGEIPAHLHLHELNPAISLTGTPLFVPRETLPWPQNDQPRRAGVSSFGFGGTNCHVIIEQAPARELRAPHQGPSPHLFTLSARTDSALTTLAASVIQHLEQTPSARIDDVCFSANAGRAHHERRLAITAASLEDLSSGLADFSQGKGAPSIITGHTQSGNPRVAMLFTGQGAQYVGMGRELYETEPVFRSELERCQAILEAHLDQPLLDVLYGAASSRLHDAEYVQPVLVALQWSLYSVWCSWGIAPRAVLGHSLGEYVAACAAGVFTLEQALPLVANRARLMQQLPSGGAMAALGCSEKTAASLIAEGAYDLSFAAFNGPNDVVVSGEARAVRALSEASRKRGVAARPLDVSHAFHSPLMEPMLDEFEALARQVDFAPPRLQLISNVTGSPIGDEACSARYWRRQIREPVRFAQSLQTLRDLGYSMFVEVGPAPVLTALGRPAAAAGETWAWSLRKGKSDRAQMLESLARLYVDGASVNWGALHSDPGRRVLTLPTYPFEHQRFWYTPGKARPATSAGHPLLGGPLSVAKSAEKRFESRIDATSLRLVDHAVFDEIVYPAAAFVEMALAASSTLSGSQAFRVEDFAIGRALRLSTGNTTTLQTVVTDDSPSNGHSSRTLEIYSAADPASGGAAEWQLHARGTLRTVADKPAARVDLEDFVAQCPEPVFVDQFYAQHRRRGLNYGPAFQPVVRLWRGQNEALGELRLPAEVEGNANQFHIHPALLDGCFQIIGATVRDSSVEAWLPVGFSSLDLLEAPRDVVWSHVKIQPQTAPEEQLADIAVFHPDGRMVLDIRGFRLKPVDRAVLGTERTLDDWLYELTWRRQARGGRQGPARYLPQPIALRQALEVELRSLSQGERPELDRYAGAVTALEILAARWCVRALRGLGWRPSPNDRFPTAELAERLGITRKYARLFERILAILAETGALHKQEVAWTVADASLLDEPRDPAQETVALQQRYPMARHEFELLGRTARSLAGVLQGRVAPLDLLFPSGDASTVTAIYQDTAGARVLNKTAARAIQAAVEKLPPNRTLRVLEVGAGTGATTSHLLPLLPQAQLEYFFTDVTPLFLTQARSKFSQHKSLRFELFDVEKDPESQGFTAHDFDLIIASNVLHATRDLAESVRHLRRLLAPGGMLLVSEGTQRMRWLDLTFGLAEGWWRFSDAGLRHDYPLVDERRWNELLLANGFSSVANFAAVHDAPVSLAPTAVILAHADEAVSDATQSSERKTWLVFTNAAQPSGGAADLGQKLATLLQRNNKRPVLVFEGDARASLGTDKYVLHNDDREGLADILREVSAAPNSLEGVILLWSEHGPHLGAPPSDERSGWGPTLGVLQTLVNVGLPEAPTVWVVTRGAVAPTPAGGAPALSQAPLWGLGRTLQLEHPELRCRLVDLDPEASEGADLLLDEILADDGENQIAFRSGIRHVARLARAGATNESPDADHLQIPLDGSDRVPFRLETHERGALSQLALEKVTRLAPEPGQVEIEVRATGLNFRDVLNAMGLYPGDPGPLGCDTAGIVVAVGASVSDFSVGDPVVAIAGGTLGSHVTVDAELVAHKPGRLTFEEAATLPVVFVTAHYALHRLAQVSKGSRVLVHAGSGGLGQAAIQLARRAGARVFASASPAKWPRLQHLDVEQWSNSRTLDFAKQVRSATAGRGVDIVLNCLTGDAIRAGLSALAPQGSFIELGKAGIWSAEQVEHERSDVQYAALDLKEECEQHPKVVGSVLRDLMQEFDAGELQPIPHRAFPIERARDAFRAMQRAEHIGKLVVTTPTRSGQDIAREAPRFDAAATYLITGGLGDLGLLVARWMVERGACHLLLVGRREASEQDQIRLDELERLGGQPRYVRADVSDRQQLASALTCIDSSFPLRGVIHAAGVLDDALLLQQDSERFRRVLNAKAAGAMNLHELTRNSDLDFFVLFASAAGVFGSKGQANHAAANAFLDSLAHQRRALGLPGLSIDWGIWSEIGAAARKAADRQARLKAMGSLSPREGLQALERVFAAARSGSSPQVAVVPIDWTKLQEQAAQSPLLAGFRGEKPVSAAVDAALVARLQSCPVEERQTLLEEFLGSEMARVLGWSPGRSVDTKLGFFDSGMDSLTALELRNSLQQSFGFELPSTVTFDYPNIEALAGYLLKEVPAFNTQTDSEPPSSGTTPGAASDIRSLLDQKLAAIEGLLETPGTKVQP